MAVVGSSVELSFLADRSIHGKEKVVTAIRDMDVESPYPKDGVDYSTLWCRFIHWSFKDITMKLHDYPQPLMELKEGYLVGRFSRAEISPQWRSIRHCTLDLGREIIIHEECAVDKICTYEKLEETKKENEVKSYFTKLNFCIQAVLGPRPLSSDPCVP